MTSLRRIHLFVSGRVQGVCYRMDAASVARRLGVTGWVRNLPDGRVELLAEGHESRLEDLVGWCRQGPPLAIVRDVVESSAEATGEFAEFRITY